MGLGFYGLGCRTLQSTSPAWASVCGFRVWVVGLRGLGLRAEGLGAERFRVEGFRAHTFQHALIQEYPLHHIRGPTIT